MRPRDYSMKNNLDYNSISELIESEKERYISDKVNIYLSKGFSKEEAINKANQSWRTYIGNHLQKIITNILENYFKDKGIKITQDKRLQKKKLSRELDLVKRMLIINYGKYAFLPDADIIVYKPDGNSVKILCIISIKNSFRERGFETTYWKLKLSESEITKDIKVFLATPDKDNEIAKIETAKGVRKMRIILEYELDGIYILKSDFDRTEKVKDFKDIFKDIEEIIKEG